MNRDGRREGEEGAAQKETAGKTRRRRKEGTVPRTGTSGAIWSKQQKARAKSAGRSNRRGKSRQAAGPKGQERGRRTTTRTETSGGQKPRTRTVRAERCAATAPEKRTQTGGEAEASDRRGQDGVAAEGRVGGRKGWVEGKSQESEGKARETETGGGGKEYKANQ